MMNLDELDEIVAHGESDSVEFKKSTSQLKRAGETLCGFLNGKGGGSFYWHHSRKRQGNPS